MNNISQHYIWQRYIQEVNQTKMPPHHSKETIVFSVQRMNGQVPMVNHLKRRDAEISKLVWGHLLSMPSCNVAGEI